MESWELYWQVDKKASVSDCRHLTFIQLLKQVTTRFLSSSKNEQVCCRFINFDLIAIFPLKLFEHTLRLVFKLL